MDWKSGAVSLHKQSLSHDRCKAHRLSPPLLCCYITRNSPSIFFFSKWLCSSAAADDLCFNIGVGGGWEAINLQGSSGSHSACVPSATRLNVERTQTFTACCAVCCHTKRDHKILTVVRLQKRSKQNRLRRSHGPRQTFVLQKRLQTEFINIPDFNSPLP